MFSFASDKDLCLHKGVMGWSYCTTRYLQETKTWIYSGFGDSSATLFSW